MGAQGVRLGGEKGELIDGASSTTLTSDDEDTLTKN